MECCYTPFVEMQLEELDVLFVEAKLVLLDIQSNSTILSSKFITPMILWASIIDCKGYFIIIC